MWDRVYNTKVVIVFARESLNKKSTGMWNILKNIRVIFNLIWNVYVAIFLRRYRFYLINCEIILY